MRSGAAGRRAASSVLGMGLRTASPPGSAANRLHVSRRRAGARRRAGRPGSRSPGCRRRTRLDPGGSRRCTRRQRSELGAGLERSPRLDPAPRPGAVDGVVDRRRATVSSVPPVAPRSLTVKATGVQVVPPSVDRSSVSRSVSSRVEEEVEAEAGSRRRAPRGAPWSGWRSSRRSAGQPRVCLRASVGRHGAGQAAGPSRGEVVAAPVARGCTRLVSRIANERARSR